MALPGVFVEKDFSKTGLNIVSGGEMVTDRYGLSTAEMVWEYYGPKQNLLKVLPRCGVYVHPDFRILVLEQRRVVRDGPKFVVRGSFTGVEKDPYPIPTYQLRISTSEEPIETHPLFLTFATAANGARWDPDGFFIGFANKAKPEFFGVSAYLAPGAIWSEVKVRDKMPTDTDLSAVGTIDTPNYVDENGNLALPDLAAIGRNWLYLGADVDQRGKVFTITRSWRLSGRRGWSPKIYGDDEGSGSGPRIGEQGGVPV